MLSILHVENLALIEHLELEMGPGFNVLTGETGAGKSLVVDAVSLLLGARASTDMIRAGQERALVEGVFFCPGGSVLERQLEKAGFSLEEDGTLILSRELNRSGRNVCRLNSRMVSLSVFQQIGRLLIDLHGQHEYQSLLDPRVQLTLLDAMGGGPLAEKRRRVSEVYRLWRTAQQSLNDLRSKQAQQEHQRELWEFQLEEIEKAGLRDGEEEELEAEERLLAGAEQLNTATSQAYGSLLVGLDGPSAYDQLSRALALLGPVQKLDPRLAETAQRLEEASILIQDQAVFLRDYGAFLDFSPERLAEVQNRLHSIRKLGHKYGGNTKEILKLGQKLREYLQETDDLTEKLHKVEVECRDLEKAYREEASVLSGLRRQAAEQLELQLGAVLDQLNMPGTVFQALLQPGPDQASGFDQVDLVFSSNPGEPPRPVAQVASGGELSRLMLALKSIMAEKDSTPTLIFDEIDAGLGGAASRAVGEKLLGLSRWHQIISVTHAPQIAAFAHRHFHISKEETAGRTVTVVNELDQPGRERELARMLAGVVDAASLAHACNMLRDLREGHKSA